MGKRKERRLAALSNAGRRVKLDLFAEPSGDLVGTSRHDDVGGTIDQNHRDGVPNSPSSPGQQGENPLLLLGQYSDDELEEKENEVHNGPVADSSIDQNEQVENLVQASDDKDRYGAKEVTVSDISKEPAPGDLNPTDSIKNLENDHVGESETAVLQCSYNEAESVAQECASGTSGMQIVGDMTNEWKIVMHEETNQYYYWNTVTGETSWEVPYVMGQGMETGGEHKVSHAVGENVSAPADGHVPVSNSNGDVEAHFDVPGVDGPKSGMQMFTEGAKDENVEVPRPAAEQIELNNNPSMTSLSVVEELTMSVAANGEDENNPMVSIPNPVGMTIQSQIMKYGESLLQRLKTFKWPGDNTPGVDWKSKCILEVEIRLFDCKALSACGSSLLPFWQHTEARLKQIELSLDAEVSKTAKPGESMVAAAQLSLLEADDTFQQSNGTNLEVSGENKGVLVSSFASIPASQSPDMLAVTSEVHYEPGCDQDIKIGDGLSSGPPCTVNVSEAIAEVKENINPVCSSAKCGLHSGEDIDMDVDMEVDDETPAKNTKDGPSTKLDSLSQSVECPSLVPAEECCVPPPPEEEWIPPPPPDNEPIPPPPPDEPEYPPPPPPYTEPVPPLPYTEQYNMAYTVPTYEYYASHTEVSNYYSHPETLHVAEPQLESYYEQPANVFPEAVVAPVNPVEPVVYYDIPNGTVPLAPVVSGIESSGLYGESRPISYLDNTSDYKTPISVISQPALDSLSNLRTKSDLSTISTDVQIAVLPSSVPAAAQAAEAVNEHVVSGAPTVAMVMTEPSTASTATTSASAATTKAQAKVRGKKRTITAAPTLRSNKKVNSLVDKWKAAKEELHAEEEDEPENAYEILERKKQREIEACLTVCFLQEWRARQISSGEALDNANFQPLGGDWREKVKRRRAESTNKTVQTPPEASTSENQQPNLTELSKDLPSGWQAYWDESSKQVYYGNAITSETTWTRPTR
ncbi:hypothetical protein ACLOJK_041667 [Asimina triloba]